MRVVISNSMMTWGGGENWSLTAASSLSSRGHSVTVVCRPGSELQRRALDADLNVHPVQLRGDLNPSAVFKLVKFFRKNKPEVIVCNVDREVRSLGVAARIAGRIPFVRRRGSDYAFKNALRYRLSYRYLVDRVLVNSNSTRNTILSGNPWIVPEKLYLIYNGINDSSFFPDWDSGMAVRAELGIPPESFVAGMMGSFLPRKEHSVLIKAAESNPSIHLILAGPAPDREFMDSVVKSSAILGERIHFTGPVTAVNDYLNAMNVFVMPSSNEGFGYAAAEAMCAGIPVIVSDATSLPEVAGDAGIVFPVGDSAALASILKKMILGKVDLKTMSAEGRKRVFDMFTLSRMTDDLEVFLEEVSRRLN